MSWDKDSINSLLLSNPKAMDRALLVLLDRQTDDEISSEMTKYVNGRGFNGVDAEFMTSLAVRVRRGWGLTPKQRACLTKTNSKGYCRLSKYHAQLIEEISLKEKSKQKEMVL